MNNNERIFITGATGFIGKFLIQELCAQGYINITALVRRTSKTAFLKSKGIKTACGDITDKVSLDSIPGIYDVVFHCAGLVKDANETLLQRVNIVGTENICKWAFERGIKKFVYTSSVAVNSGNTEIPLREDLPYKATNRYGISKLEGEKIAIGFRNSGLPMVIVRPCMVYGEGEPHMMALLARLIKLRLFFIPDYGKAKWHLVSVRNVAACLVHCMEDDRALGETFNIADKEVFTTREVIGILSRNLAAPGPFLLPHFLTRLLRLAPFIGKRIKFLCKDRVYSIERLESILGFTPSYQAVPELARAAAFFRQANAYCLGACRVEGR